jgi:hypothetical protein
MIHCCTLGLEELAGRRQAHFGGRFFGGIELEILGQSSMLTSM